MTMRILVGLFLAAVASAALLAALTLSQLRDPSAEFAEVRDGVDQPRILDRHGEPLQLSRSEDWNRHDRLPLHQVPAFLKSAFLAAEDRRFFAHPGDDWLARGHAALQNLLAGRAVRGASTITEQVVRMLHPRPRELWSRWLEGWEARAVERQVAKPAILEFYLNQVPYAANRRGVVQAARYWFDRDLETLSRAEMLALAVLVRAPSRLDPIRDADALRPSLVRVAEQMVRRGQLRTPERDALLQEPLLVRREQPDSQAEHFVRHVLAQAPAGEHIRTTLDGALQRAVQGLLDRRVQSLARAHVHNGAVLIADHTSGEVLAWAVAGFDDQDTPARYLDAVTARRQPGSTLKPFVYALALERGWTAASLIDDSPLTESVGAGLHRYHNYSHEFHGPLSLRAALGNSLNIPALRAVQFVGAEVCQQRLRELGFTGLDRHPDFYGDGLALGNGEVSLLELVQAYAALANRGVMQPLKVLLDQPAPDWPRRVYSKEVASLIGNILSDPRARDLEFGAQSVLNLPVQTAVKTGTSSDYRDAWAVGYDQRFVVGVWLGNLDRHPTDGLTGATGPALLLRALFAELNRDGKTRPLYLSPRLVRAEVCTSASCDGSCPTRSEWFLPGTQITGTPPAPQAPAIRLRQPSEGLNLAMDPRLAPTDQAFEFHIQGLNADDRVDWRVDGRAAASTSGGRYLWPLSKGAHRVSARVIRSGQAIAEIDETRFLVK